MPSHAYSNKQKCVTKAAGLRINFPRGESSSPRSLVDPDAGWRVSTVHGAVRLVVATGANSHAFCAFGKNLASPLWVETLHEQRLLLTVGVCAQFRRAPPVDCSGTSTRESGRYPFERRRGECWCSLVWHG
jgi:hypothetical protein